MSFLLATNGQAATQILGERESSYHKVYSITALPTFFLFKTIYKQSASRTSSLAIEENLTYISTMLKLCAKETDA